MSRSMYLGMTVLAVSLLMAGCDEKKPQANNPAAPVNVQAAPGRLFDPLERDKQFLAMKQPARWRATGQDRNGGKWEGYLIVEHTADAFMSNGFFEWSNGAHGGRYRFEGKFDPDTRLVKWTGFNVEDRFGNPVNAHYQATLSEDGHQFLNGSWQGGVSIPGTWNAEFLND